MPYFKLNSKGKQILLVHRKKYSEAQLKNLISSIRFTLGNLDWDELIIVMCMQYGFHKVTEIDI